MQHCGANILHRPVSRSINDWPKSCLPQTTLPFTRPLSQPPSLQLTIAMAREYQPQLAPELKLTVPPGVNLDPCMHFNNACQRLYGRGQPIVTFQYDNVWHALALVDLGRPSRINKVVTQLIPVYQNLRAAMETNGRCSVREQGGISRQQKMMQLARPTSNSGNFIPLRSFPL